MKCGLYARVSTTKQESGQCLTGGCVGDGAFRFSYLQREYLRRHEFSSPVLTSSLSEHTSRNP
jgi:hypothetical protein